MDVQAGGLNRKRRPTLRLYSGARFPLGTPFGKRIPLYNRIPGRDFRLNLHSESVSRSFTASWLCKVLERYSSYAPSSRSSHSLRSSPPAYPLSEPSAATTRWHGTIIEMGLRATAAPTARGDTTGASFPGTRWRAATRAAISPYVATSPRGIESSSYQTSR